MHTHRTAMGQILAIAKLAAAMYEQRDGAIGSLLKLTLKYGTRYVKAAGKQRAMMSLAPLYATGGPLSMRQTLLFGDTVSGTGALPPGPRARDDRSRASDHRSSRRRRCTA